MFAHEVERRTFADFTSEIERQEAVLDSKLPYPFYAPFHKADLKDMQRYARPGDEVAVFEDRRLDKTYFCLMRGGQIVKTYAFIWRAR